MKKLKQGEKKTIKIDKLKPSPFRNLKEYPLEDERLAKLTAGFISLGDWGGLVCRPHPDEKRREKGFYQLAFGHHRIHLLEKWGEEKVEMTVFDYDDVEMYLAMVTENREYAQTNIRTRLNDVEQGRKLITDIRKTCETVKDLKRKLSLLNLKDLKIKTDGDLKRWKGIIVGATSILALLNKDKKTWIQSDISFALKIIDNETDSKVDKDAVLLFDKQYPMTEFVLAIEKINDGKTEILNTEGDQYIPLYEDQENNKDHYHLALQVIDRMKKEDKGGRFVQDIVNEIVTEWALEETDADKAQRYLKKIGELSSTLVNVWGKLESISKEKDVIKGKYVHKAVMNSKMLIALLNRKEANNSKIKQLPDKPKHKHVKSKVKTIDVKFED